MSDGNPKSREDPDALRTATRRPLQGVDRTGPDRTHLASPSLARSADDHGSCGTPSEGDGATVGPPPREPSGTDVDPSEADNARDHDAAPTHINLRIATEWASVVADDMTLGALLRAYGSGEGIPEEVVSEMEGLLTVPLSQLSGHEATPFSQLIDELVSEAADPELLAAREFCRVRPTLATLGEQRDITGERVRKKVAEDVKLIRAQVASDRFRSVRWAARRLEADLGLVIPIKSHAVRSWKASLGEHGFEVLRWIAGYVYGGHWLLHGASARSDFAQAVGDAAQDNWLLQTEDLYRALGSRGQRDAVLEFLLESSKWREIGEGWLVRWDGPIQAKAERVLRLTCRPMTPAELVEAIGHGSERSLKNQRGSILTRIDKNFRLALPEWGYEEYEDTVTEIKQRIERGGGVASRAAIIDEFTTTFGLRLSAVESYLGLPIFDVSGDRVRLADKFRFTHRSPATIAGAIQTENGWGERKTVTDDIVRGYSFAINPHIAWANGIRPSDHILVPINNSPSHTASIIWRTRDTTGRVDVGRTREWLIESGIDRGLEVLVCPTPRGVTIYAGQADIAEARRAFEEATPSLDPKIAALMEGL